MVGSGSQIGMGGFVRLRFVVISAIALCTLALALANGASAQTLFPDDPRLDLPVTYDGDGPPIGGVLSDLSTTSKVNLFAGLNKDDWMAYDRRVIVHVNGIKLRDLMSEFATILHFSWTRGGDPGKWAYCLAQTKSQWDEEDNLRSSARQSLAQGLRQKREAALSEQRNAVKLPDKSGLRSSNPWLYVLATQPLGTAVVDFLDGCPAASEAFLNGTQTSLAVSELPAPVRDAARRLAESYAAIMKGLGGPSEEAAAALKDFDQYQIAVNRRLGLDTSDEANSVNRSMLGRISVGKGGEWIDIPLFDPSTDFARGYAKAILSVKPGADRNAIANKLAGDTHAATLALRQRDLRNNADVTASDLPAPFALFKQPAPQPGGAPRREFTKSSLPETLAYLASATKFDIVSDFFVDALPSYPIGKTSCAAHLALISALYDKKIVKVGNLLRISDQEWYAKRAWDVPMAWLSYWAKVGTDNGGLVLGDLMQIAALRDEQLDHAIMYDPILASFAASEAVSSREILRFLNKLSVEQRKALESGSVSVKDLNEGQLAALRTALAAAGGLAAISTVDKQTINLSVTSDDQAIDYRIRFYPSPDKAPVQFRVGGGFVVQRGPTERDPSAPVMRFDPHANEKVQN